MSVFPINIDVYGLVGATPISIPDSSASDSDSRLADLRERGPLAIRIGQILALRPDDLTSTAREALLELDEWTEPMPWDEARSLLVADLIAPLEDLFAQIETTPIASTPLHQSHRAKLLDGREATVKVLRSEFGPAFDDDAVQREWQDLNLTRRPAFWDAQVTARSSKALAKDISAWLKSEFSANRERACLERLRQLASDDPRHWVPEPVVERCGPRVLTTLSAPNGLMPIPEILGRKANRNADDGRQRLATHLAETILVQIASHRFFQPDFHPSNILAAPDGSIVFASYGRCLELSSATRSAETRYLAAVFEQNFEEAASALFDMLGSVRRSDFEDFRQDYLEKTASWTGLGGIEACLAEGRTTPRPAPILCLEGGLRLARLYGLTLPPEIAASHRAIITAHELAIRLDPALDPAAIARNVLSELRARDSVRSLSPENMQRGLLSLASLVKNAPKEGLEILALFADDRFDLNVNVSLPRRDAIAQARRGRLIVTALACLAASILLAYGRSFSIGSLSSSHILVAVIAALAVWFIAQLAKLR